MIELEGHLLSSYEAHCYSIRYNKMRAGYVRGISAGEIKNMREKVIKGQVGRGLYKYYDTLFGKVKVELIGYKGTDKWMARMQRSNIGKANKRKAGKARREWGLEQR